MKQLVMKTLRMIGFTPLCALLALTTLNSFAAQKNPSFVARRDFIAAENASIPVMGDLNGDGTLDVVVPDHTNDPQFTTDVSVLLGNRDGSFQAPRFVNVGGVLPFGVVIADFNGDGKQDLAVTTASGVSILVGDGHGNFGTPTIFRAGTTPSGIVAGDFNGDGKLDLAVANFDSNNVSVFLGEGNGSFTLAATIPVGLGPNALAVGDFNGDGHTDLAVTNVGFNNTGTSGPNGNTVAVILGVGNGQFQPPSFIPMSTTPQSIAVADFNHDHKLDLVVVSFAKSKISVLLGNGDGTFKKPKMLTSGGAAFVAVDDFNGDGNPDLVVVNTNFSTVSVFFGDGKGDFPTERGIVVGRTPVGAATGDFNRDGKRDLLTSNADGNSISVVLGNGNGTFQAEPHYGVGPSPVQLIAADFNNDGILDLATADSGTNTGTTVSILLGNKDGTFETRKSFTVGKGPVSLAAADFNKDGKIDLVVASDGDGQLGKKDLGSVDLLLGNGDGTFQPAIELVQGSIINGELPIAVVAGDFNGDGNPDFIVNFFAGVRVFSLFEGDGKGGFNRTELNMAGAEIAGLSVHDFNNDGIPDLAIQGNGSVAIALGKGDGTFQPEKTVTTAFFSAASAVGDFNNDGILDFAVEEGGQIETLLGDGKGNFTSVGKFPEKLGSGFSVTLAMAVGDFNGDGLLDVASTDGFGDTVDILLGKGDGTLNSATQELFGGVPNSFGSVVSADFNGDHRTDLAISSGQGVAVLLNNTPERTEVVSRVSQ